MEIRVLIVDDEPSMLDLLENGLRSDQYCIETSQSAEHALKLMDERCYQIVFIDLQLPGMNGLELAREIRNREPMAILFAMTGYPSLFQIVSAREAGFDDYLTKPFPLLSGQKLVDDALEKIQRWRKG